MYEIEKNALSAENFIAGPFPIVTEWGNVEEGVTVRKYAPVIDGENGIEEITAAALPTTGTNASPGSLDKIVGIAADDSSNGKVIYYLTGEFFSNALTLPSGVTANDIKPALRKIGIFLKELN